MQRDITEKITYSTVRIKCIIGGKDSSFGTGFFVSVHSVDGNPCTLLITNNHVVEGSQFTEIEVCEANEKGDPIDSNAISFRFNSNLWTPHPDTDVDLCCIPISEIEEYRNPKDSGRICFITPLETDHIPSEEQLKQLMAIEEVVMVGYPLGFFDAYNHKPIVRRGITATHPNKDYMNKKVTLLDIAVYPGSSGSPVIILNQGSCIGQPPLIRKVLLLGVVYRAFYDPQGMLPQAINIPTQHLQGPDKKIFVNLAMMIKSEKILDFEKMLQDGTL